MKPSPTGMAMLVLAVVMALSGLAQGRTEPDARCPPLEWCSSFDAPPKWGESDPVEVIIVHAPVFEARVGPWLKYVKLYHSGFVFHNLKTDDAWTWEYDSMSGVNVAAFPVVSNATGEDVVVPCNAAAVCGARGYNQTYWSEYALTIANTTGGVFNRFNVKDIPAYNATHDQYDLFDVLHSWDDAAEPEGDQDFYLRSETCFSAPHDWATALRDHYGVQLLAADVKEDFITLYSHAEPEEMDPSDPDDAAAILKFFKIFDGSLSHMFAKLIERVWKHNLLVFHHGKYYRLNDKMPYFRWHYARTTLVV